MAMVSTGFVATLMLTCRLLTPTPTHTAELSLAMSGKKKLCLCTICKQLTHTGRGGVVRPGCMLELRRWKAHATDDALRAADQDYLLHHALVASIVDTTWEPSLATGPHDMEDNASVRIDCIMCRTSNSACIEEFT